MATTRTRPYRRILTSALHRRFVHASALALLVNYIVAFLIGKKSSFLWSWFPIGTCGLRTVLLFITSLSVFVLRVGQMHVGPRSSGSSLRTLRLLFPLHIIQTFGWYAFSAWWFSEVYVWSASRSTHLAWVNPGRLNERPTLNERPIYLHCFHLILSVMQAVCHLYFDYDRIYIPVVKRTAEASDQRTHPVEPAFTRIRGSLRRTLAEAFGRAVVVAAISPLIYSLLLRRTAWNYTLYFAKLFWDFPRTAAVPSGYFPSDFLSLLVRSFFSGALLLLLWQTANLFFTVFIAQEPLKRGQPLTTEAKDPTGSLLNGLKARKEVVQTFAFWELCFISQRFPDRRKAIFSDIDREGGPAWTQIFDASVDKIKGISNRIQTYKKPPSPPKESPSEATKPQIQTLPRLTEDPKQDNIFAPSPKVLSRPEKLAETISKTAKAYGQSPDWTPQARAAAREMFNRASTAVLSPERKQKVLGPSADIQLLTGPSPTGSSSSLTFPFASQILQSPLGKLFRQNYPARVRAVILGTPYAELSPIVDAIESVTRFLVASLAEDPYGKVQADVPVLVRLFTATILTLNDFAPAEVTQLDPAIQTLDTTLRVSLAELLKAFKLYLGEVGLKGKDLRLAKAAAGIGDEDEQQ